VVNFYVGINKGPMQKLTGLPRQQISRLVCEPLHTFKIGAGANMDLTPYVEGIRKTGFPFEYWAAEVLQSMGWQVVTNRYYLDTDENKPRELDIIAYKVSNLAGVSIYTVVLVSCKKSDSANWVFLTRAANKNDPNVKRNPVRIWTNYKSISYASSQEQWGDSYQQLLKSKRLNGPMDDPNYDVFAIQEMWNVKPPEKAKNIGDARGDSNMFNSVVSLIKAQNHELKARASHASKRKKPVIYQFNLVSLADTNFVRLHFDKSKITTQAIDQINYLGNYLIDESHVSSRITFVTKSKFKYIMGRFEKLHALNIEIFTQENIAFYNDILKDTNKIKFLQKDFFSRLASTVKIFTTGIRGGMIQIGESDLTWNESESLLEIEVSCTYDEVKTLNSSDGLKKSTARILKDIFKFDGNFCFTEAVPF